jgi:hypothetical protein
MINYNYGMIIIHIFKKNYLLNNDTIIIVETNIKIIDEQI